MFSKVVSGVMLFLFLSVVCTWVFNIQPVKASGTIYIRADGSIDPPTAPVATFDNITYTLTNNIRSSAGGIVVERDDIVINGAGYTLQGTGLSSGIDLSARVNVTVTNTNITTFYYGIYLNSSSGNRISANSIANHSFGYLAFYSNSNIISRNNIANNYYDGVDLHTSSGNNTIDANNIINNGRGVFLSSSNNIIHGNRIADNWYYGISNGGSSNIIRTNNIINNTNGLWFGSISVNNEVYHNNFINNIIQAWGGLANIWDNGYPSGGNYWSDYTEKYPDAEEIDDSGSWDTPYVIDENNQDNYPLVSPWSERIIDVPFYYQSTSYYCGPACLEMVFDHHGEDIPQLEIAEVARTYPYSTYTDELRRAAHFSNISTSKGTEMPENITGYALRQLGYATFEKWSMTIDQLKMLIDNGFPIVLLMWYSPAHASGHYRVAVGYNNSHMILHDPWNNVQWGGTYGGPYLAFNYSTFLDLWSYSDYWGLFTSPWHIEIDTPSNIQQGENFTVAVNLTYPCPVPFPTGKYPSSLCNATITLPEGLALSQGEASKKALGNILPGTSVTLNWTVEAENCGIYNLTIEVEGKVAGSVSAHGIFPNYSYEDRIGAKSASILSVSGHDLSIKSIILSKTIVGQEYKVIVNITIKNEGSYMESLNLTVYANETIIATESNASLSSGNSKVITCTWNTASFAKGNYTIQTHITMVPGEVDTADNTLVGGWIVVTIPGDVDGDFDIDIFDVVRITSAYASECGDPRFDPNSDIDGDGVITIFDVVICTGNYGKKWS